MARQIQSPRDSDLTATIASAASLSGAVDLEGYRIAAVRVSSGWSGAVMTFQQSNDGTSFINSYDDAGNELTVASGSLSSAAARAVNFGATLGLALATHRYVKFRSGTAGSPVNTTAACTVVPVLLPV